jgi:hypothetical protein
MKFMMIGDQIDTLEGTKLDVPCAVYHMDLLRKNRKERLFMIRRHE